MRGGEAHETLIVPHVVSYAHALPHVTGKNVVDLCCGTGYGTKLLAEAADSVTGIDYQQSAIEYAKRDKISNCIFIVQDLDQEIPDFSQYHVVTCFEGLEHLKDPKGLVDHIIGQKKVFIFSVPNEKVLNNPHHHHIIDQGTLQEWLPKVELRAISDSGQFVNFDQTFGRYFGIWRPYD